MAKEHRFGGKQQHGHSRSAYFAQAEIKIAKNKAIRAARQKKRENRA